MVWIPTITPPYKLWFWHIVCNVKLNTYETCLQLASKKHLNHLQMPHDTRHILCQTTPCLFDRPNFDASDWFEVKSFAKLNCFFSFSAFLWLNKNAGTNGKMVINFISGGKRNWGIWFADNGAHMGFQGLYLKISPFWWGEDSSWNMNWNQRILCINERYVVFFDTVDGRNMANHLGWECITKLCK